MMMRKISSGIVQVPTLSPAPACYYQCLPPFITRLKGGDFPKMVTNPSWLQVSKMVERIQNIEGLWEGDMKEKKFTMKRNERNQKYLEFPRPSIVFKTFKPQSGSSIAEVRHQHLAPRIDLSFPGTNHVIWHLSSLLSCRQAFCRNVVVTTKHRVMSEKGPRNNSSPSNCFGE